MPEEIYEESQLYKIRHSAAHVMAEAMLERFPEAKVAIGPPIEDGFYYDFDLPTAINDDDIRWVEKRMKKILSQKHDFSMREVTAAEAREIFQDQPYKLELIDELVNERLDEDGAPIAAPADRLTIYRQNNFSDLCRGPHVASTRDINPKAVSISLRPPAGAYWRGDEKRQQLTRIYGTAWETAEDLRAYRQRLEEAIKRDHRVLGEKLDLFIIDSMVGKGLPLWLPDGATLRDTLERWLRDIQIERGYLPVVTPHLGNIELYKTSGHYPYYADSQYTPIDVDGDEFLLRPMNCPHHCRIYTSQPRSYRDLPLRYAEFGTVYRYEQSGELRGLTRVRGFTVDDAHLFVRPDQLLEEFQGVVKLIQHVFNALGMTDFRARLGTRDPDSDKYVGDNSLWEEATVAIINACEDLGMDYHIEPGEAAFYGPKLDFIVRDVLKREWQLGTVQVDYNLPQRFDLEYVDRDNERKRPVMIHRAPFGSLERFIGILIEHFAGAFPPWLAPTQAVIIPIRESHNPYAREVEALLKERGMRVKADLQDRNMRSKIKQHRRMNIPWLLIVGDRDMADRTVSVRLRTDENLGALPLDGFADAAAANIESQSQGIGL
ncbi:MAG: threonine--tRNA ligase [Chloroflexota bacterium]|nr:threonine--tRNA ligase [Chloroflexota bacterium]MDE2946813.1 threonine--tRNA ligase [Chloroflexota bacterium]